MIRPPGFIRKVEPLANGLLDHPLGRHRDKLPVLPLVLHAGPQFTRLEARAELSAEGRDVRLVCGANGGDDSWISDS